jgi:hypothetical protein
MVAVLVVAVGVVVVAVVLVAAFVARRRGNDEAHSIDGYRQTLETLQGIRSRSSSGVRILSPSTGEPLPPEPESPGPPRRIGEQLVFEDPAGGPGGPERSRVNRRAMASINHRPRRLGPAFLAVVVAVVVVVVLVVAGTHVHRHSPTASGQTQGTTHPATSGSSHSATGAAHHHASTTTTSTLPPTFTAQSTTGSSATYVPPAPTYSLSVVASKGNCWVLVESEPSGKTAYEGVLSEGAAQTFPSQNETKIELGAPGAVTISLDNEPVVLPSSLSSPYSLVFEPAQTAASANTTTTAPVRGVTP